MGGFGFWPVAVQPMGPVACGTVLWRAASRLHVTVVVKARFAFAQDRVMQRIDADPINPSAGELAPYLAQTDVVVTAAHAYPSPQRPVSAVAVRLAVIRDWPVLDKRLLVYASDPRLGRSRVLFTSAPVVVDEGAEQQQAVLLDPAAPAKTARFGPLAESAPERLGLLQGQAPPVAVAGVLEVPEGFRWDYFQVAPPDQRIGSLRGDEWIVIDGLHPTQPRMKSRLPAATAQVRVYPPGGSVAAAPTFQVAMQPDRISIDADQQRCSLLWRGSFPVADEATARSLTLLGTLQLPGEVTSLLDQGAPIEGPLGLMGAEGATGRLRTRSGRDLDDTDGITSRMDVVRDLPAADSSPPPSGSVTLIQDEPTVDQAPEPNPSASMPLPLTTLAREAGGPVTAKLGGAAPTPSKLRPPKREPVAGDGAGVPVTHRYVNEDDLPERPLPGPPRPAPRRAAETQIAGGAGLGLDRGKQLQPPRPAAATDRARRPGPTRPGPTLVTAEAGDPSDGPAVAGAAASRPIEVELAADLEVEAAGADQLAHGAAEERGPGSEDQHTAPAAEVIGDPGDLVEGDDEDEPQTTRYGDSDSTPIPPSNIDVDDDDADVEGRMPTAIMRRPSGAFGRELEGGSVRPDDQAATDSSAASLETSTLRGGFRRVLSTPPPPEDAKRWSRRVPPVPSVPSHRRPSQLELTDEGAVSVRFLDPEDYQTADEPSEDGPAPDLGRTHRFTKAVAPPDGPAAATRAAAAALQDESSTEWFEAKTFSGHVLRPQPIPGAPWSHPAAQAAGATMAEAGRPASDAAEEDDDLGRTVPLGVSSPLAAGGSAGEAPQSLPLVSVEDMEDELSETLSVRDVELIEDISSKRSKPGSGPTE